MAVNEYVAEQFLEAVSYNVDTLFKPQIVLPGDDLSCYRDKESTSTLKIGQGILLDRHNSILATQAGQLSYRVPASYWVDTCRRRYLPKQNDQVVGVIDDKGGDFYVVNIFTGCNCIINRLAFEGATKRNRPELKKGDVVYARVQLAGKDIDTELTCISSSGIKKDWSSGETVSNSSIYLIVIPCFATMAELIYMIFSTFVDLWPSPKRPCYTCPSAHYSSPFTSRLCRSECPG